MHGYRTTGLFCCILALAPLPVLTQTSDRDASFVSPEATPATSPAAAGSASSEPVVVTGSELEENRLQISLEAGTSTYTINDQQIDTIAQHEHLSEGIVEH